MSTAGAGRGPVAVALRTTGVELLLLGALPLNLALTITALARSLVKKAPREQATQPRTILISGGKMTKALQLARCFHGAGHRVVLVEQKKYRFTGHRFSRAVDRFLVVPRPQAPDYVEALLEIVRTEGVDVYVPVCSPIASWYDALAGKALAPQCEVMHGDPDMVARLDDKHAFASLAASVGLAVPDTHRVTSPDQVADLVASNGKRFILKSIAYDPIHRLDLTTLPLATRQETVAFAASKPISADNPWIVQEFIEGQEYCTHSTVRDGQVQVHCCCRSSPFQINYEAVDHPGIETWVRTFVQALGLTGQVSFDFMQARGGQLFAIECNPRTHSAITTLYNHPGVATAYLKNGVATVRPLPSSRPTYWIYHEAWRLLTRPGAAPSRLRTILGGKDAIFDWSDPLPFLLVHHVQIPWLLLQNLWRGRDWIRIDFNIGKLVEPAGD